MIADSSASTAADAEIRQDKPNTNFGAEQTAQVGIPTSSNERRALFYFDVSSIPSGASISSASLTLKGGNAAFGTIDVHNILAPWSEATVTWNSLGSSFSVTPAATFTAHRAFG